MHLNGSKCISQRKFSSHGQCSYLFLIVLVSDKGKKETLQMFKAGKSSTTLNSTQLHSGKTSSHFFKWWPFRVSAWTSPSHLEKIQTNEELLLAHFWSPNLKRSGRLHLSASCPGLFDSQGHFHSAKAHLANLWRAISMEIRRKRKNTVIVY